ncbi:hypothetical protein EDC19_0961 [Natranaerovirga hydrolytica]|uniref:RloB-like protein n=1 Tax=Natranaerovirga hydrolytica TaxID=680378 RepID=A0A4R1N0V6_9FIRM|nr:hypothetical protein [Natranaerovirga hydrolytica]TCK98532.1 hypothetical protein EDC19_0961 [Natranaerovirga hydrolytica]
MSKRKLSYTKAVIICHGKSESQLCKFIRQNLRISIDIYDDKNGEKSIQITSLKNHLNNRVFQSIDSFTNEFPKTSVVGKGRKRKLEQFRLFIIMDTDDCSESVKHSFINKEMFKNHWAFEYIEPIFNISNLEEVLNRSDIIYQKSGKDIKKQYIKIFPTDVKYIEKNSDTIQLENFMKKLQGDEKTNMERLIQYCLECKN